VSTRVPTLVALALLLAGCGGGAAASTDGAAALWVTRDEGAEVLVETTVDAGQTAMQALDRETELETRYGGRFVQSIDGIAGSLERGRDWFYFINGYEADRSAAEYRLRAGDVVWFDYRDWRRRLSKPVVVGAYPEPFVHGFAGKRRPTVVVFEPALADAAERLARELDARPVACCPRVDPDANVLRLVLPRSAGAALAGRYRERAGPGEPVEFELAAHPAGVGETLRAARFSYEWKRAS
jgi:hypothetical protein